MSTEYRRHDWLQLPTRTPRFSIQFREDGRGDWRNLSIDGVPTLFENEHEREKCLALIRKNARKDKAAAKAKGGVK